MLLMNSHKYSKNTIIIIIIINIYNVQSINVNDKSGWNHIDRRMIDHSKIRYEYSV